MRTTPDALIKGFIRKYYKQIGYPSPYKCDHCKDTGWEPELSRPSWEPPRYGPIREIQKCHKCGEDAFTEYLRKVRTDPEFAAQCRKEGLEIKAKLMARKK